MKKLIIWAVVVATMIVLIACVLLFETALFNIGVLPPTLLVVSICGAISLATMQMVFVVALLEAYNA